MKRIIFRLFIAILSLATGLVSVWLINSFVNINHSQKNESFYPKNKASVEKTSDGEFVLVSRGCGQYGSNSQTYHFKTGAILEGVNCDKNAKRANKEFQKLLAKAETIVEKTKGIKNCRGETGERIVLEFRSEKGEHAEILWYDGSKCFYFIKAPTLELALEFERRQEIQKQ